MHVIRFILGASCKPSFVKRKIDWITHKCTKCIEIYLFIYFIYLKNLPVTAGVTIRGHRGSILQSWPKVRGTTKQIRNFLIYLGFKIILHLPPLPPFNVALPHS
jgi:hypothetical protein